MKYLLILFLFLPSCEECIEPQVVGIIEMTPNPDAQERLTFKHLEYRQYGRYFRTEQTKTFEERDTVFVTEIPLPNVLNFYPL
jgi:hypothetical protein